MPEGPTAQLKAFPRVLMNRYEIGALLGTGGMAEVYLGRDRLLDRQVAVKTLRRDVDQIDANGTQRLRNEARMVASLNHPAVVAVYDIGLSDHAVFIVMEYIAGRTLKQLLRAEWPLPLDQVAHIIDQVCSALDVAHCGGLVHRDITPGNIMVCGNGGSVKLMDFGISRAATSASHTATNMIIGSPPYMSPEQVRGEALDGRSDLYALGCCLYELLTGRPPFAGSGAVEIAACHLREPPAPLTSICPDIPERVEDVVLRALAKRPAQRYQNAMEMAADLRHAVRAEGGTRRLPAADPHDSAQPGRTRPRSVPLDTTVDLMGGAGPVEAGAQDPSATPTSDIDLGGPDDGRRRRLVGIALIVGALAALVLVAVLLLYARL